MGAVAPGPAVFWVHNLREVITGLRAVGAIISIGVPPGFGKAPKILI